MVQQQTANYSSADIYSKRSTKKRSNCGQPANCHQFDKIQYTANNSMFSVSKKKKINVQSYESVIFFSNIKPIQKKTKQSNRSTPTLHSSYSHNSQSSQSSKSSTQDNKPQNVEKLPSFKELFDSCQQNTVQ